MRRGWRGRARAVLLVLAGVLVGMTVSALPAAAHAYVLTTDPANGTELDQAPAHIAVTFNEPISLPAGASAASMIDSAGHAVDDGSVRVIDGGRTLIIGVRTGLAKDTYIVSWSVISADTHPVGGSILFGYGIPASMISPPAPPKPSAVLELLVGLVKGVLYLGLLGSIGVWPAGLLLGVTGAERRVIRRLVRTSALVAAGASVVQVITQYLWTASSTSAGASWGGLLAFSGTRYALLVFLRVGLIALGLLVLSSFHRAPRPVRGARAREMLAGIIGLGILGMVIVNGHGGTGAWWYFVSTLVHVSAVVAWFGGLVVLGLVLRPARLPSGIGPDRLRRLGLWSQYAATCVALLAISGVIQAVHQVRYPGALIDTDYGLILIVKLVLVAAALLLGLAGNRWVRRQREEIGPDASAGGIGTSTRSRTGPAGRLRTRVWSEAGVGAVIILVSGVLSSVNPAVTAYAPAWATTATVGPYAVNIEIAPARRGPQVFRITARANSVSVPPPQSLALDLKQSAGGIRALPVEFTYRLPSVLTPGRPTTFTFISSSVNVPASGGWSGTLTVIAGATQQYTDEFDYPVL